MDDAEHSYELRQIKLRKLHELDKQAALLGEAHAPTHILVERAELRAELGLVDSIIGLPMRPQIGEELGPNGRFLAYLAESKRALDEARRSNDGIALLGESVDELRAEVRDTLHSLSGRISRWAIGFGVVLAVLVIVVTVVITILATKG